MWKSSRYAIAAGLLLAVSVPALAEDTRVEVPKAGAAVGGKTEPTSVGLAGLPIYSSDGEMVGSVESVETGDGGAVTAIKAEIDGFLGLGTATVSIMSDKFAKKDDRIVLVQTADEVRGVPGASHQSFDGGGSGAPPPASP